MRKTTLSARSAKVRTLFTVKAAFSFILPAAVTNRRLDHERGSGQKRIHIHAAERAVCAEHRAEVRQHNAYIVACEYDPADDDEKQRVRMPEKPRQLIQRLEQEQLFDKQDRKIVQAPHNEVPARAVPEAGKRPDYQQVKRLTGKTAAVAAKGDV